MLTTYHPKRQKKKKHSSDRPRPRHRRRVEVTPDRVALLTSMLTPEGPNQSTFEDGVMVRKALDWNKKSIPGLLVTDAGGFMSNQLLVHGVLSFTRVS